MPSPANIFNQDQLAEMMGYKQIGDVERKLIEQGIRPIYGKIGHFFVTIDMLNSAGGIVSNPENKQSLF